MMSDIRIWATDLCFILIITGLITKLVSGKSEKFILRLVVVLILITVVFNVKNLIMQNNEFDFIEGEMSFDISRIENGLMDKIRENGITVVKEKIESIIIEFDKNSKSEIEICEDKIIITVFSDCNINPESINNRLKEEFECEFEIHIGKLQQE